jgi:hypothetical protein
MEKLEDLNLKDETASQEAYDEIRIRSNATFAVLDSRQAELFRALDAAMQALMLMLEIDHQEEGQHE